MKMVDRKEREPGWDGKKRWLIDYRDQDGKRKTPGFETKAARDREFTRLHKLKERGWHPSAEADHITFGVALDRWLEEGGVKFDMRAKREDKFEASTLSLYTRAANLHVRPAVGHLTLAALAKNPQPLQKLLDKFARHTRTPELLKSIINGTIEFAFKREHWLTHNFLLDHELIVPQRKRKTKKPLTLEQRQALMQAIRDRRPQEKRYMYEYRQFFFALGLSPGFMRRGEMAALHWEDFRDGQIHVHRTVSPEHTRKTGQVFKDTTKTDRDRWVPQSDTIRQAMKPIWIRQGQPTEGLIMKGHTGKHIYGQIRDMFLFTMRKAGLTIDNGTATGIGIISLHGLRSLGESMHLKDGALYKDVARWAGHSEETLRKHYEAILDDDDRSSRVAGVIDGQLQQLMLPSPEKPATTTGDYQYEWRQRQKKAGNKTATEASD
jgi:integrase